MFSSHVFRDDPRDTDKQPLPVYSYHTSSGPMCLVNISKMQILIVGINHRLKNYDLKIKRVNCIWIKCV